MWIIIVALVVGWGLGFAFQCREYQRWRRLNEVLYNLCLDSLKIQHWPHVNVLAARYPDAVLRVSVEFVAIEELG